MSSAQVLTTIAGFVAVAIVLGLCTMRSWTLRNELDIDMPSPWIARLRFEDSSFKDLFITFDHGEFLLYESGGLIRRKILDGLPAMVTYLEPLKTTSGDRDGVLGLSRDSQFYARFRYVELSKHRIRFHNSGFSSCIAPYGLENYANYTFSPLRDSHRIPSSMAWMLLDSESPLKGHGISYEGSELVFGRSVLEDYIVTQDSLTNDTCFSENPVLVASRVHIFHCIAAISCVAFLLTAPQHSSMIEELATIRPPRSRLFTRAPSVRIGSNRSMGLLFNAVFTLWSWFFLGYLGFGFKREVHYAIFSGMAIIAVTNALDLFRSRGDDEVLVGSKDLAPSLCYLIVLERSLFAVGSDIPRFIAIGTLLTYSIAASLRGAARVPYFLEWIVCVMLFVVYFVVWHFTMMESLDNFYVLALHVYFYFDILGWMLFRPGVSFFK